MAELLALLSNVQQGREPNQRLNWLIWWYAAANNGNGNKHPPPEDYERDHWRTAPRYLESLDVGISLAERVLPGCNRLIGKGRTRPEEPLYGAQILDGDKPIGEGESEHNEARALVAAILSALIARRALADG